MTEWGFSGKLFFPMRRPQLFAVICSCVAAYAVGGLIEHRSPVSLSGEDGALSMSLAFIVPEAQAGGEIRVGDELMAIDDVSLDEARICKGSKVSVSGRAVRSGKVFLDVALADGHVVRAVPMVEIWRSFRVVNA